MNVRFEVLAVKVDGLSSVMCGVLEECSACESLVPVYKLTSQMT
jgi:hypothetical protein